MELLVVVLVVLVIAGLFAVRAERRYERLEVAVKAWLGSLTDTQLAHIFANMTEAQRLTLMEVNKQLTSAGRSTFVTTEQKLATEPASPTEPFVAPATTCVAYLRDPDDVNCGLLLVASPRGLPSSRCCGTITACSAGASTVTALARASASATSR